jgi:hypothetical protein
MISKMQDLYVMVYNTQEREISLLPSDSNPQSQQANTVHCAATGIG